MNTHESYVSLETAKLLKERGFDWECKSLYCTDVRYKGRSIDEDEEYELKAEDKGSEIEYVDGGLICDIYNTNNSGFISYSRPTLAVAQRWLRDVHHSYIMVNINRYTFFYGWKIIDKQGNIHSWSHFTFSTYEEALESGIKYCLEHLIDVVKSK